MSNDTPEKIELVQEPTESAIDLGVHARAKPLSEGHAPVTMAAGGEKPPPPPPPTPGAKDIGLPNPSAKSDSDK